MTTKDTGPNRRDFLKLAGTAAPAVALTSVAGTQAEAAEVQGSTALIKTEYIRKYLESARF